MAEPYEPRRGNPLLDRLSGRSSQDPPGREESVRESYDGSRPNSEDDLMLDIRLSDGSRCALSYGTLLKIEYSPADQLTLAFAIVTVVIQGRKLLPLYDLLRRHRAKFVQEGTDAEEGLKPENASHIDNIHFETTKEDV